MSVVSIFNFLFVCFLKKGKKIPLIYWTCQGLKGEFHAWLWKSVTITRTGGTQRLRLRDKGEITGEKQVSDLGFQVVRRLKGSTKS